MRRLTVVAVAAVIAGACSHQPAEQQRAAPPPATALVRETGPIRLQLKGIDDNGTRTPPPEVVGAITWTLDRWLTEAVLQPLRTAQPTTADTFAALFTPAALERATADDRGALTDEGLPATADRIDPVATTVTLSSVAGPDEQAAVIAATVDVRLHAVGHGLDLDVVHQGDLVLVPNADGSGWRIDGYDLRTSRESR